MMRDEILQKLKAGVTWSVMVDGVAKSVFLPLHLNNSDRASNRKGAMQPITMSVKTRQGRKTITHVSGLETFSIDIDEFAEVLRKLCAGSASGKLLSSFSHIFRIAFFV